MKNHAERETNGKLTVEWHPAGELGNSLEMVQQMTRGDLDMVQMGADTSSSVYSNFQLFSLPYPFPNSKIGYTFWNNSNAVAKLHQDAIDEAGVRILGISSGGGLSHWCYTADSKITSMDDFEGMKFRAGPGPNAAMFNAVGANPVDIDSSEGYSAMDQGLYNGESYGLQVVDLFNLNEIIDYVMLDAHQFRPTLLLMNESSFQNLPREYQLILREGALKGSWQAASNSDATSNRIQERFRQEGIEFYEPSDSLASEMKSAIVPAMREYMEQNAKNPEWLDQWRSEIAQISEDWGYEPTVTP